jgi:hypothetical protein
MADSRLAVSKKIKNDTSKTIKNDSMIMIHQKKIKTKRRERELLKPVDH